VGAADPFRVGDKNNSYEMGFYCSMMQVSIYPLKYHDAPKAKLGKCIAKITRPSAAKADRKGRIQE
jgi:hypothetical protein